MSNLRPVGGLDSIDDVEVVLFIGSPDNKFGRIKFSELKSGGAAYSLLGVYESGEDIASQQELTKLRRMDYATFKKKIQDVIDEHPDAEIHILAGER